MRRIVIDMQNALVADALSQTLNRFDSDFQPLIINLPEETFSFCSDVLANVVIMEVTSYPSWKIEERLKICCQLRSRLPECKIVLMVDENTEKRLADQVRQAKKDGLIDNFIYESISSEYFSAVIDTL